MKATSCSKLTEQFLLFYKGFICRISVRKESNRSYKNSSLDIFHWSLGIGLNFGNRSRSILRISKKHDILFLRNSIFYYNKVHELPAVQPPFSSDVL